MGKIKDAKIAQTDPSVSAEEGEPTSYSLLENEFNYLMNMNVIRMNLQNELSKLMSAYLFDIAIKRLDYNPKDQLKFELDFEDPKEGLKIWKLGENLYKPTEQEHQPEPQTNLPVSD
jgi:hypothetical protein